MLPEAQKLHALYQAVGQLIVKALQPGGKVATELQHWRDNPDDYVAERVQQTMDDANNNKKKKEAGKKIKHQMDLATAVLGSDLASGMGQLDPNDTSDFAKCAYLLGVHIESWTGPLGAKTIQQLHELELRKLQQQRLKEVAPSEVWLRLKLCVVCCVLLHS